LLGGTLVDHVFEPIMAGQKDGSLLVQLFGSEKGTGAALFFLVLAVAGSVMALSFLWILRKERWTDPVTQ
ncbi:MAG: MFS transporter, partial [Clostridia bacterium]|nr:MFS transporter [Clostridia bacterium]